MAVNRVLVGVALRSLNAADQQVTLAQFRVVVVLATRGPQRPVDLATTLAIDPSTATRMCDRLARGNLVHRQRLSSDRRAVRVTLTPTGGELFERVRAHRRAELHELLDALPTDQQAKLTDALRLLADTAGETPDHARAWGTERAG